MNIWSLRIVDVNGGSQPVCGAEEVLRATYEEWKNMVGQPDGTTEKLLEVIGMCDSADRAELSFAIRSEDIRAMSLTKLY